MRYVQIVRRRIVFYIGPELAGRPFFSFFRQPGLFRVKADSANGVKIFLGALAMHIWFVKRLVGVGLLILGRGCVCSSLFRQLPSPGLRFLES